MTQRHIPEHTQPQQHWHEHIQASKQARRQNIINLFSNKCLLYAAVTWYAIGQ
jgi:hypothetical protein